jgi:hypothetical protein
LDGFDILALFDACWLLALLSILAAVRQAPGFPRWCNALAIARLLHFGKFLGPSSVCRRQPSAGKIFRIKILTFPLQKTFIKEPASSALVMLVTIMVGSSLGKAAEIN